MNLPVCSMAAVQRAVLEGAIEGEARLAIGLEIGGVVLGGGLHPESAIQQLVRLGATGRRAIVINKSTCRSLPNVAQALRPH